MKNDNMINFYQFGNHMNTVAIATALALIPPITPFAGLIALIFIFSALEDIKIFNYELFDTNLNFFRKNYIRGFIYTLISVIFVVGGAVVLGIKLGIPPVSYEFWVIGLPITITFMVIGLILFMVGCITEMKAWENLKLFFMTNKSLFPEHLRQDLIEGSDILRSGALSWAFGIFVIPAIVGWILQAVGFSKLAKLGKLIDFEPIETQTSPLVQSPPYAESGLNVIEKNNFCPNCGSKLGEKAKFCPICGSHI